MKQFENINACLDIIYDKSMLKPLNNDPTVLKEDRLQRLPWDVEKQGSIDNNMNPSIFPRGSQSCSSLLWSH